MSDAVALIFSVFLLVFGTLLLDCNRFFDRFAQPLLVNLYKIECWLCAITFTFVHEHAQDRSSLASREHILQSACATSCVTFCNICALELLLLVHVRQYITRRCTHANNSRLFQSIYFKRI